MSSGLPDYYRGIDVTYQTLSEIINRPKYGAANTAPAAEIVNANALTEIVAVEGKGMLYGGSLNISANSTQRMSVPILEVDGVRLTEISFFVLNLFKERVEHCKPLYLLSYNNVTFVYTVGISNGITFESSFRVLYYENHGSTPVVWAGPIYALV